LAYAGGAVMFWFHAIYRGEQGPAISPWYHWLLDSSLGFFGLTPALFLILPAALWILQRTRQGSRLANTGRYVAVVGAIFAAVTGPGPVLHDLIDKATKDATPIRLGPVGGRIVAEVFAALLLGDRTSYLNAVHNFTPIPELTKAGTFGLAQLINVALGRTP
ncbi:MAG: hypothetical protein JWL57_621, partial [Actinobacteria bacterium]|nr:hypothetical protein [Actinomycetota bacterium]